MRRAGVGVALVAALGMITTASGCAASTGWSVRHLGGTCRSEVPIGYGVSAAENGVAALSVFGATKSDTTGLQVMHVGFAVAFVADAIVGTVLTYRRCHR